MYTQPVTLEGYSIRLEPLAEAHVPDLAVAGRDPAIWRYMLYGEVTTEAEMRHFVQTLLAKQAQRTDLPFAVIDLTTGRAIGCSRFMEMRPQHRGLEIGGTWYAPPYQRTHVNTACKFLLLRHAFEALGCLRVQLKTDVRNERSRRAIERLGAVQEGIFRNHIITPDGFVRDSVYYSILDREWPAVKANLQSKLILP